MKFHKENIKTIIVIFSICGIIAGLVLFLNRKTNYENLQYVDDYNEFFSISNCVNKYINYLSNKDNDAVYSLLDEKYLEETIITKDNLFDKIENYSSDLSINIIEMKYAEIKKNKVFYIKGELIKNSYDSRKNTGEIFESLLLLDTNNQSYSIYPLNNDLKNIVNSIKKVRINKNNYNKIEEANKINKERMCVFYLSNYVDHLFNDLEKAYELLSDSMKKNNNFASFDNFSEYINNNINRITTTCDKCSVEEYKNKVVYSIIDKNNNKYSFTAKDILNYKVDIYINSSSN